MRNVLLNNVKPIISLWVGSTTMNIILKLVNVEKLSKKKKEWRKEISGEEAKSLALLRNATEEESFLAG